MKIENDFLDLITYKNNLNEAQFKIFKINSDEKNWKKIALEQDISKNDMNLLMLLRGDFSTNIQEQIIKNYHTVLEHNNIKAKVYTPKVEEKMKI